MSASLILSNNNEPLLNQIMMCNEKWILYNNQWWPAQWSDWEEAPKHFPKPNLHQKKRSWSLFGGLLLVWSLTAFWILAKPLVNPRSMLSKLMRCTENWKPQCLQPALANRKGPILLQTMPNCMSHSQHFNLWMNWTTKFCLILHMCSVESNSLWPHGL